MSTIPNRGDTYFSEIPCRICGGFERRVSCAACKPCSLRRASEYREVNKEKAAIVVQAWKNANPKRTRELQLLNKYGITLDIYHSILRSQGGRCAVCSTEQCVTGKNFAVDHDHNTGNVRGLLCQRCNTGIGKFRDDPEILSNALAYVTGRGLIKPLHN